MTDYAARRAGALRQEQREDRRFHIIMGASCGLVVLLLVAVAWLAVATEPRAERALQRPHPPRLDRPAPAARLAPPLALRVQ